VLYEPEAFEPLTDEPWDAGRVADGIRAIVADADAAYDADALWPAAEWDVWAATPPLKNLYVGASGVVWALDALRRRGHAETTLDLASAARRTVEAWRETPDYVQWDDVPTRAPAALLMGESGPLLAAWRVDPSTELADRLLARVRENADNEAVEIMWGAPGTMLAARAMLDWTGEERWADAWRESSEAILDARDSDGLWTNRLYGETYRSLGPPHGLVGNVHALRAGGLLTPDRIERLERETAAILERLAVTKDGLTNWPARASADAQDLRLQWCHGAPGIVAATAPFLNEELLLAGAELTWQAGPPGMEKGPAVCHGTAGNGYAFLKALERTGDELWLDRARRFTVHALGQVVRRGHGRYSLWTGDVGAALYAADCLEARTAYPVLDTWD
jgi:hypothetical protein